MATLTLTGQSVLVRLIAWGLLLYAIFGNFSISLSQITLSLTLIATILLWRKGELKLHTTPLTAPFFFLTLAGLLSVFTANEILRAISEMKKFFILVVFYLSYWPLMNDGFKKKILTAFVVTASLVSILVLANVPIVNIIDCRACGFFSNAITFGECQAIVAIVIMSWLMAESSYNITCVGLSAALLLVVASMIASMSRGAWLGFISGVLLLIVRFPRKMLPIVMIMALITAPIIWFTPALRSRIEAFSISKNIEAMQQSIDSDFDSDAISSNYQRMNIWYRGFKMTENCPIFGVGMNNVKKKFYELASDYERHNSLIFGHQHSNFMQIYAMTGLLGLSAFFIFIVTTFKFMFKSVANADSTWNSRLSLGAAAVFVTFITTGFTEYSWADEEVAMMTFFITGLLLNPTVSEPEIV